MRSGWYLFLFALLLSPWHAFAQVDDKTMSWIASGDATATYTNDNYNLSLPLTGSHAEITFWQDRSPYTDLFDGLHLMALEFSGEGEDPSGNTHAPQYQNLSLLYSLGYDLYLANFIHIQPFLSYGAGITTYSKTFTASDGTITPYEEKTVSADFGTYGVNLILELTGKLWLGFGWNNYLEKQAIEYLSKTGYLEPTSSQTIMLVWNWERLKLKTINPKDSWW